MRASLQLSLAAAPRPLIHSDLKSPRAGSSSSVADATPSPVDEESNGTSTSFHSILGQYRGTQADDSSGSKQDANPQDSASKQKSTDLLTRPAHRAQASPEIIPAQSSPAAAQGQTQGQAKSSGSSQSDGQSAGPSDATNQNSGAPAQTAQAAPATDPQTVVSLTATLGVPSDDASVDSDAQGSSDGSMDGGGDSTSDQTPDRTLAHTGGSKKQDTTATVSLRPREAVALLAGAAAPMSANGSADAAAQSSQGAQNQAAIPAQAVAPASDETDNQTSSEPSSSSEQERVAVLPMIDVASTSQPASTAPIAMAAKLTPVETPGADASADAAAAQARRQIAPQNQGQAAASAPDDNGVKLTAEPSTAQLAKVEAAFAAPASSTASATETAGGGKAVSAAHNSTSSQAASQMQTLIEAPQQPAGSGHDITIKLADASERGMDLRFVERGGEVHVAIRTSDGEMAQTLRSGLNDFTGRMEHAGVRAEVWRPGADASASQSDTRQQQAQDQRGSSRNQSGSQDPESNSRNSRKPRWVEAMEETVGSEPTLAPALGETA